MDIDDTTEFIKSLTVDITDSETIPRPVSFELYNKIQAHMIWEHKYYLGLDLGREPTELQAAQSWVEGGYAKAFETHYNRIKRHAGGHNETTKIMRKHK